jgi:phosphatidylglycerol:prolipoprotein diacylglycerol transferase
VESGHLPVRHPSQLYQALGEGFLLFALLWFLRKTKWSQEKSGRLSLVFLLGYAVARFAVEFFREPDARLFLGWMTTGQFLSLFMIAGAGGCLYFMTWTKRTAASTTVRKD